LRPDASFSFPDESEWFDLEICFALTNARPGDLSSVFENNILSDRTRVYEGTLTVSTEGTGPLIGPMDFD
jgi:hypothetical protein